MKSLNANVAVSYNENSDTNNSVRPKYAKLSINSLYSPTSSSNDINTSFIILFFAKKENKTNIIEIRKDSMFSKLKTECAKV